MTEDCSTKRKACCLEGEEAVHDCGLKVADAVAAGEESSAQVPKGTRLPDEEVKWILARKREYPPPGMFTAEEMKTYNYLSDSFTEYQDWVREQYNANGGVVLLDDEQLEQRLKNEQMVQDLIDEMNDFSVADLGIETSDRYSDFYETSDEEEEEESDGEEVIDEINAN